MQLITLASGIVNEETREQEIRRVMRRENREPLHIREELLNPREVINNHMNIERDPELAERYLHTQAQAISHFDDVSTLLGDECVSIRSLSLTA